MQQREKPTKRKVSVSSIYFPHLSIFISGKKSRIDLLALASRQMNEEKEDLAQFIANRGSKVVDEALQVGWEMEEAEEN